MLPHLLQAEEMDSIQSIFKPDTNLLKTILYLIYLRGVFGAAEKKWDSHILTFKKYNFIYI